MAAFPVISQVGVSLFY